MRRPSRFAKLLALLAVVVATALVILTYAFVGNPLDPFDDRRFSASAWGPAAPEVRARMCRDVIRRHLPAGTPEATVIALLGTPEEVGTGTTAGGDRPVGVGRYEYDIGNWSLLGMDAAFLYVHLDAEGRVIRSEIDGY